MRTVVTVPIAFEMGSAHNAIILMSNGLLAVLDEANLVISVSIVTGVLKANDAVMFVRLHQTTPGNVAHNESQSLFHEAASIPNSVIV